MDRLRLREELIRDEGERLIAYRDNSAEKNWTIGVGHLLGSTPRMSSITKHESRALLEADIDEALGVAHVLVPKYSFFAEDRQRALVNMAFNLGMRLAEFKKFLAALNAEDWNLAATEMMDSKWAGQVKDRAERLKQMILRGVA
jgi:lysozyme